MPKIVLARLEETVRLCDEAIDRLERDPDLARSALLEEMRAVRAEHLKHIALLREAIDSSTHSSGDHHTPTRSHRAEAVETVGEGS